MAASNAGSSASSTNKEDSGGSGHTLRNLVVTAVGLLGGALLLRKFSTKTPSQPPPPAAVDHTRKLADALVGERFSTEQAIKDSDTYLDLRLKSCPAAELEDGSRVIYVEQAFASEPVNPYIQRFLKVKPCPKDFKCDVEVASFTIRNPEEYENFCERPKEQRPQPVKVVGDIGEHLTTLQMLQCLPNEQCLYKGSTPPGGIPNSLEGATTSTSDLVVFKDGTMQCWDRGYNVQGIQVWGIEKGPYEFKLESQK
ncbi:hypothetical protein KP509_05G091700 [Ceratopteris richardii]|uniref:Uncharacterized protein n=1 Tax=Ceratopteris richardii TaxID=49495 RepID=A0A8T2V0U2_CERRI|nr:hypothetical protein KP509_05G091700 [Ceratopteris richardii]